MLYVWLTPVHALALPLILGVGNAFTVMVLGVVSVTQPAAFVSFTLILPVPALPHKMVTLALVTPFVAVPPVIVHKYVLPMLFCVEYVCVLPAHTPTVARPLVLLVTLGVGNALMVTLIGADVPTHPVDVSATLTTPVPAPLHTTVILVDEFEPLILPPVTVQRYVEPVWTFVMLYCFVSPAHTTVLPVVVGIRTGFTCTFLSTNPVQFALVVSVTRSV